MWEGERLKLGRRCLWGRQTAVQGLMPPQHAPPRAVQNPAPLSRAAWRWWLGVSRKPSEIPRGHGATRPPVPGHPQCTGQGRREGAPVLGAGEHIPRAPYILSQMARRVGGVISPDPLLAGGSPGRLPEHPPLHRCRPPDASSSSRCATWPASEKPSSLASAWSEVSKPPGQRGRLFPRVPGTRLTRQRLLTASGFTRTLIHTRAHVVTCTHAVSLMHVHAHPHTRAHTFSHSFTHTHTHIHMNTHMPT